MLSRDCCYTGSQSVIVFHWCVHFWNILFSRVARTNAWLPMLSTMIGCLMLIISLATVLPTMHAQWSVPSWLSFGIYTLIAFPRSTHQWSFLGLNFWPNQTVEKPSNEFDLIGNPISKGKFWWSAVSCFFCVHRFPEKRSNIVFVCLPQTFHSFSNLVCRIHANVWDGVETLRLRFFRKRRIWFFLWIWLTIGTTLDLNRLILEGLNDHR